MVSAFNVLTHTAPAEILLKAIVVCLAGIALLLSFIVLRRWLRARYFARRDRQMVYTRQHWEELISGTAPPAWRFQPLASEVVETMLLDSIEVSQGEELARLVECLRRSGLLDKRIQEARWGKRWRRREALVMLGRTRAAEAIPALSDALDADDMETRIAAVRGMGKLALPEAAIPMLLRFCQERLSVPWAVLKNALGVAVPRDRRCCCRICAPPPDCPAICWPACWPKLRTGTWVTNSSPWPRMARRKSEPRPRVAWAVSIRVSRCRRWRNWPPTASGLSACAPSLPWGSSPSRRPFRY